MAEIWKDIPGYEGMYQISNIGRVKSLERTVNIGCGKGVIKERILKPAIANNYLAVMLSKNGKPKNYRIHKLVAELFVDNPGKLPVVNHKDFDRLNNCACNLEWTTQKQNVRYSRQAGRYGDNGKGRRKKSSPRYDNNRKRSVVATNTHTGLSLEFDSIQQAKDSGWTPSSIYLVLNGTQEKYKGHTWKYAE